MLSFGDIEAWARLTGKIVRPEEIAMILAMDLAFVSDMKNEQKLLRERQQAEKPQPKRKR